jgi:hypothetical protein
LLIRAFVAEVFDPLDGQDVQVELLAQIDPWLEKAR